MSNKAIRDVMSPAELSLGIENKQMSWISIYLFSLLFQGENLDNKSGDFPSFKPTYFAFFFFFSPQVSFSEQPEHLRPTVSGKCLSPTGSSKSPHPQREAAACDIPSPGMGWGGTKAPLGLLGEVEPGTSELLCGHASINLWYPVFYHFPPFPCPKKKKNYFFFSQAAFCTLQEVLWSQPLLAVAPLTSPCSWVTPKIPLIGKIPFGGVIRDCCNLLGCC